MAVLPVNGSLGNMLVESCQVRFPLFLGAFLFHFVNSQFFANEEHFLSFIQLCIHWMKLDLTTF